MSMTGYGMATTWLRAYVYDWIRYECGLKSDYVLAAAWLRPDYGSKSDYARATGLNLAMGLNLVTI